MVGGDNLWEAQNGVTLVDTHWRVIILRKMSKSTTREWEYAIDEEKQEKDAQKNAIIQDND